MGLPIATLQNQREETDSDSTLKTVSQLKHIKEVKIVRLCSQ